MVDIAQWLQSADIESKHSVMRRARCGKLTFATVSWSTSTSWTGHIRQENVQFLPEVREFRTRPCFTIPFPRAPSLSKRCCPPCGWAHAMAFRPESQRSSLARVSLGGANNRGSLAGRPSLAAAKRPSMAPVDDRRSRGPSMGGR